MAKGSEPDINKEPVITAEPEKGKPAPLPPFPSTVYTPTGTWSKNLTLAIIYLKNFYSIINIKTYGIIVALEVD